MSLRIRDARVEDYPSFERWFPMLESGDRTPTLDAWTGSIASETIIAELDGAPAGYCRAQAFGRDGYVRHLVVEPSLRRSGAGRAMLEHVQASLREAGCERWRINVKPDNVPAVRLYASLGMETQHMSASVRFPWSLLEALPEPSGALSIIEPDIEQRRVLESTYALPMGQLATADGRDTAHVRAVQGAELQGVALFDAAFPGAFPFRTETLDAAISLLHGLRPLATQQSMGIVVEDDAELDQCMVDAGARVPFRFAHMRGSL